MRGRLFACTLVLVSFLGGLTIWQMASRRHQPLVRVVFGDETPSALGKFEYLNGEKLELRDDGSDRRIGDFPSIVLIGEMIEITSLKYHFAVTPTQKQSEQNIDIFAPGTKSKVKDNGEYTVLVFDDIKATPPHLIGKSYFAKVDEKGLEKTLSEIKKRLNSLPVEAT